MSSLARATAVMTFGTVLSRVTGLLRLAAIAAAIGIAEDRLTDTYNLANTAPNIIYELVLGGILTSVFVPLFVELLEKEGRERAWDVASAIINVSMIVLLVVTALGIAAAPLLARLYSFRVPDGAEAVAQQQVLTFLLRLLIPQILFYALTAITGGLLNAHRRFAAPMYTPILNNLAVISVFAAFYAAYGQVGLRDITAGQQIVIGAGTTLGVVLMCVAQLPFLRGLGRYRWTLSLEDPAVRKLARLSVYVIGYVVVNQIGYFVVQILANRQQGGYSAYISAFTFFLLPHGLFAVSVITALLPAMSRHAINGRWEEFVERLSTGVRATILLILPAAVGFFVLGEPIVRFLLERGVMTTRSTELVASVLQLFVVGLVPFALFQLFLRAFYALQDTKTPFVINCLAVAVNTAINVPMFAWLGVRGLAAGHAIAYTFGVVLQARALVRRTGGLDGPRLASSTTRIAAAAAGMGIVVWGVHQALGGAFEPDRAVSQALLLAVPIAVGAASYVGLAQLLKVRELDFVRSILRRTALPRDDGGTHAHDRYKRQ